MKHLKLLLYVLALSLTFTACDDDDDVSDYDPTTDTNTNSNDLTHEIYSRLEFPKLNDNKTDNLVLVHKAIMDFDKEKIDVNYCVEWNVTTKSPRWVCYKMDGINRETHTGRYYPKPGDPQYPQDDLLPPEYQFPTDPFYGSGYDHGHICPSADRLCSSEANYQTFFLTNMMPQTNAFNAGVWQNMESTLRNWIKAGSADLIYVCKGGTIESNSVTPDAVLETTSKGLLVPKYYYMAVLKFSNGGYSGMAFWAEHKANDDAKLLKYAISIDELERRTGIDFFCNLPDKIENRVESAFIPDFWELK